MDKAAPHTGNYIKHKSSFHFELSKFHSHKRWAQLHSKYIEFEFHLPFIQNPIGIILYLTFPKDTKLKKTLLLLN